MKFELAEESRPQLKLLILATLLSVAIWFASWYFPFASYIVYPLQLFATFVHEGSHVLAALMTGGSVQSLTVAPDTSGAVWSVTNSWLSQMITSSAGYLGTTLFGIVLLVWLRYKFSSRNALYFTSGFVAVMTLVFGFLAPLWNFFAAKVTIGSVAFTVISGAMLAAGLFAVGKYAALKWVNFSLAFLAVQCLLNSVFSLKTLFYISATTNSHSDAMNMANATGVPAVAWVLIWIVLSIVMISIGMRLYAVSNKPKHDLPFED
ncbi:MAG: M50 family metallopeptidase [Acidobacteriota bacterium]|nr:M50 family metallopeptidase [Acidobacteriota bacterium]